MLKVGCIGSCRVYTPLQDADRAGRVSLQSNKVFGFIHNTREILQAINVLRRRDWIPKSLHPLVALMDDRPLNNDTQIPFTCYNKIDAVVIEISSVRDVKTGPFSLQINKLREHLMSLPGGKELVPLLYKSESEWKAALHKAAFAGNWSKEEKDFFLTLDRREQSFEELVEDLLLISANFISPVVFACHFVTDYNGAVIPQRALIRRAIQAAAEKRDNVFLFDPTVYVEEAGHQNCLIDLGHYKSDFQNIILDRLIERLALCVAAGNRR